MPEGFHEPEMTEDEARLDRIARRIIVLSRSTIVVNMRYLDSAVFKLMPVPGLSPPTDGSCSMTPSSCSTNTSRRRASSPETCSTWSSTASSSTPSSMRR